MLLSKQINALNYIQIQSHHVEPDDLMPIIISSMVPKIANTDLVSSCDSENNQLHASDDDTLQEDPITTIVKESDIPPPVPKQKPYQHKFHEKKKKKKDCSIM